eukprot:8169102-Heterocapsa_arctica.AAC.1
MTIPPSNSTTDALYHERTRYVKTPDGESLHINRNCAPIAHVTNLEQYWVRFYAICIRNHEITGTNEKKVA